MKCSMPASLASSTTYWIKGLSTMVSISFGIALVAGRTRVPRPATGKTALRIFMGMWEALARVGTLSIARRSPLCTREQRRMCGADCYANPCNERGQQRNLSFIKLLETATRPSETAFSEADGNQMRLTSSSMTRWAGAIVAAVLLCSGVAHAQSQGGNGVSNFLGNLFSGPKSGTPAQPQAAPGA